MHTNLVFTPPFRTNFGFPTKTPNFKTIVQQTASLRGEIRVSLTPYPIWTWDFPVNWMKGSEQDQNSVYQYLLGFFMSMGGQLSDFLYEDPYDNQISASAPAYFGTGDGKTTIFQLVRPIGMGSDIVQNLNGMPTIYVNGSQNTSFVMDTTGVVTFNNGFVPPSGSVLAWSGNFYYRVRFDEDSQDYKQFMDKLWSMDSLKLRSVIL
jgi:uncharacterized protein (TIGR02217 family)